MEGSIPACAGETRDDAVGRPAAEVYPRVCGGNRGILTQVTAVAGLSPRVRGKRPNLAVNELRYWSIPACAGETTASPSTSSTNTVYPRVCGGNRTRVPIIMTATGLSPRVRGKQDGAVLGLR